MARLIGVGDNTVDTYIQERVRYPGGNAVNVAVLAKRYGIESAYLGSLGGDDRGRLILESLVSEGIDVTHCKIQTEMTNAYVEVDIRGGDRVFGSYDSGAAAVLKLSADDLTYIRTFDLVHTSIYSFLEDQVLDLRRASNFLSIDFSSDLNEMETIQRWLPHVDLAACSLSEHPHLAVEEVTRDFRNQGTGLVLITQGMNGSWVYNGEDLYHQPIVSVDVVDTMGAGDAYITAFLIEIYARKSIPEAMTKAAEYAGRICKHAGAFGYGQTF
jgi:fructoselysine 6-kinase